MPTVWTVDGDENSWGEWAVAMAQSGVSPLAEQLLPIKFTSERKLALDIGSGTGRSFLPLHQAGFDIIGIDLVMVGLRASLKHRAKDGFTVLPVQATGSHLPVQPSSIDLVLAIGVLFHLNPCELDLAIRSIKRVLKADGKAILHFLGFQDWRKSLAKVVQPEQVPVPSYRAAVTSFCSEDVITDRLEANGLKILSLELLTKKVEQGIQENWVVHCIKE